MPKTMDAAALTKAQAAGNKPVYLVELALDSGTLYLCDAAKNVTFPTAGTLYLAWGFSFDGVNTSVSGDVDRVAFAFDNTDLAFRAYTDTDEFQGKRITLKVIFSDLLGSSAYATTLFTGIMMAPELGDQTVVVRANSPLYSLNNTIPRRRYQSNCHWRFDDAPDTSTYAARTCRNTELVVNGTMEADSNWNNTASAPATNEQSTTQVHNGTYSRKFVPDAVSEGILSDAFSAATVTGAVYAVDLWVFPNNGTRCRVVVYSGVDGSTKEYDAAQTGLTQGAWNKIAVEYTETAGGALGKIQIDSDTESSGDFYVDDVTVQKKVTLEKVAQTADAGSTDSLIVDAARSEAADYWLYGTIEMTDGTAANIGEIRTVSVSAVGNITLLNPMPATIAAGDEYTIKRGCNKTSQWCNVKHDNWINHGGFVGLPQRKK
jgi:hypothetical protein